MIRYDAAVIGSGPAGLEAAINLKIRKKKFLLFGHGNLSTKLSRAPRIDNYLGFPGITGQELQERMRTHLQDMEIELTQEQVSTVYPMEGYFALATNHSTYEATTVILASGVDSTAAIAGEERLLGHGVGYCATCDAPLYRGKAVAIIGYSDNAVYEANFVSEIAEQVYYIAMGPHTAELNGSIIPLTGKPLEIEGELSVSGLKLTDQTIRVDGVFVLRETIAPTKLVSGISLLDGFVQVDHQMATSLPGLFAAGDCTGKPHQYMRAAGQGQVAALSATAYLDRL